MKKFGSKRLQCDSESNNLINDFLYFNNEDFDQEMSNKLFKSNVLQSESDKKQSNYLFKTRKEDQNCKESNNKDSSPIENNQKRKYIFQSKRLSELEEGNLYFTLGVAENSENEIIKKAYRELCKIHHPDKGGDTTKFNKIVRAYEILTDDICRKLYDRFSSEAMNTIEFILAHKIDRPFYLDSSIVDNDDLEVIKILLFQNK